MTQDAGRESLQSAAAQPPPPVEPTSAERSALFAQQVKERMQSRGEIKGQAVEVGHQLGPNRLTLPQSSWRTWDAIPEFGTTIEEMLEPSYWAHVAKRLAPWDQLVIRAEDGSLYAEAIVLESGQLHAKIMLKPGYPIDLQVSEPDVGTAIPEGYSIKWTGPVRKYAVVNRTEKVRDGFSDRGAAQAWLGNYVRTSLARARTG